jgi:hypothetical protein
MTCCPLAVFMRARKPERRFATIRVGVLRCFFMVPPTRKYNNGIAPVSNCGEFKDYNIKAPQVNRQILIVRGRFPSGGKTPPSCRIIAGILYERANKAVASEEFPGRSPRTNTAALYYYTKRHNTKQYRAGANRARCGMPGRKSCPHDKNCGQALIKTSRVNGRFP